MRCSTDNEIQVAGGWTGEKAQWIKYSFVSTMS